MARRAVKGTPGYVGVFKESVLDVMLKQISTLRDRMLCVRGSGMTVQDALDLFVPPEHQELARAAHTILKLDSVDKVVIVPEYCTGYLNKIMCYTDFSASFCARTYRVRYLPCGPALDKLTAWQAWRHDIAYQFGCMHAVLSFLNEEMSTPAQVRHVFTGVVALLRMGGEHELAARIERARTPEHLPAIHPGLRAAARAATELIAKTSLLPSSLTPKDEPVKLRQDATTDPDRLHAPWPKRVLQYDENGSSWYDQPISLPPM